MLLACNRSFLKNRSHTLIFNFGYLKYGHHVFVSKYVKIPGYFSKRQEVREQKRLGNTALGDVDLRFSLMLVRKANAVEEETK